MPSTPLTDSCFITDVLAELPTTREATTSRVLVSNPLLRVVDFAFDAGQQLTSHSSPRAVVVTLLDGELAFDIGDETRHLKPGDVVYLAPGAVHALRATTACHLQLVMVDLDHPSTDE